jgi:hypothetical protein
MDVVVSRRSLAAWQSPLEMNCFVKTGDCFGISTLPRLNPRNDIGAVEGN